MEDLKISGHSRKLAKGINLSDLTKDGCELVFNKTDEEYEDTFDTEHDYNFDDVMKFAKLDLLEPEESGNTLDKYKKNMISVPYGPNNTEDGKLMKRIKSEGIGECPVLGAHVQVHYMYYTELQEIPIDITYLRKSFPEKFILGASGLIEAFEYAILSMKKGEKSDFFASYELCFKEHGCPPRIPPKADLLFEIQLVNFTLNPELTRSTGDQDSDVLVKSQSEEPQFERVLTRAKELGAIGKLAFGERNTQGAIRRYREAVRLLLNTQVMNQEDQMQLEEYLCKVYRNLMILHNSNKDYKSSCACANNALQFAHHYAVKDHRLFFLWGKAQNGIQEWTSAIRNLKTALKLTTKNSEKAEIEKEIRHAETKYQSYQSMQRSQFGRMFGPSSNNISRAYAENEPVRPATLEEIPVDSEAVNKTETEADDVADEYKDFKRLMEINMTELKMNETVYEDNLGVTAEFTRQEIDIIKQIARKIGLKCKILWNNPRKLKPCIHLEVIKMN
uniref:peptidylprolyl isomerase n=1 Tax=Cacopsylla melanoneura TaxID=428564 RepID=A0A8D8WEQ6_9HEMI